MYCSTCTWRNGGEDRFCQKCAPTRPVAQGLQVRPTTLTANAKYASFRTRLGAYIIDCTVALGLVLVISYVLSLAIGYSFKLETDGEINAMAILVGLAVVIVVPWVYWAAMESSSNQATLGEMALAIIVTDHKGKRISFWRATGRHFARIISALILLVGYIMIAFTERKQGLHDIMTSCLVLKLV